MCWEPNGDKDIQKRVIWGSCCVLICCFCFRSHIFGVVEKQCNAQVCRACRLVVFPSGAGAGIGGSSTAMAAAGRCTPSCFAFSIFFQKSRQWNFFAFGKSAASRSPCSMQESNSPLKSCSRNLEAQMARTCDCAKILIKHTAQQRVCRKILTLFPLLFPISKLEAAPRPDRRQDRKVQWP